MAWQAKRLAEWQHGQRGWMGIPLNSMLIIGIGIAFLWELINGINGI